MIWIILESKRDQNMIHLKVLQDIKGKNLFLVTPVRMWMYITGSVGGTTK